MEQYVDFNGGAAPDDDSPSPAPQQHSSPPQVTKKLVHSPVVGRTSVKQAAPALVNQEDDASPTTGTPRQIKGKQKAGGGVEATPLTTSTKINGKLHANLTGDDEQETPTLPQKSRSGRISNEGAAGHSPSKGKATRHLEPLDDVQPEAQYDEPRFGDDGGGDPDQDFGGNDLPADEGPPDSGSEQSEGESETAQKKTVKKSSKGKEVAKGSKGTDADKKRRRKADDDPPRQTKRPRSNGAKPSSQGRVKTPEPDRSYLEGW